MGEESRDVSVLVAALARPRDGSTVTFARYFAVPDPLRPGELSYWYVRHGLTTGSLSARDVEPWPASAKKTWGVISRSAVPVDTLADPRALHTWLNETEARALETVAASINEDPGGAALLFAKGYVRCFCCGKRLTDKTSKARGIGPDCLQRATRDGREPRCAGNEG